MLLQFLILLYISTSLGISCVTSFSCLITVDVESLLLVIVSDMSMIHDFLSHFNIHFIIRLDFCSPWTISSIYSFTFVITRETISLFFCLIVSVQNSRKNKDAITCLAQNSSKLPGVLLLID